MIVISILTSNKTRINNIALELQQNKFVVQIAASKEEAWKYSNEQLPAVMLADSIENPDWDINQFITSIRLDKYIPVILLLRSDTLKNLELISGVDDFIVAPWETAELKMRINRVLKKSDSVYSEDLIKNGDLVVDLNNYEVFLDGKRILLTFKEYELLKLLIRDPGRVYSRQRILDKVWGFDYFGGDRTVDVHIRRLRSKIEDPRHSFISTVHNMGYKFKKPRNT